MKILQQPVKAKRNEIIQIHFDKPVVVRLLSKIMFERYKNGGRFTGQGGKYNNSPAKFTIPYDGIWHAVIERESHFNPINVQGKVELLPPEVKETSYFVPEEEEETPELSAAEESSETVSAVNENEETDLQDSEITEDEDDSKD